MKNFFALLRPYFSDRAGGYTLFSNRDILRLVLPLLIEQLLFMLVGTADTLMVASLGDASISAVSLADMFNNFIASVFFGLTTGGAVVVSQCIGSSSLLRARESAKQLLVVSLIIGGTVFLGCEFFLADIVRMLFGSLEPDVHTATMQYFRITLGGLPFIAVYGGCTALFRSMNRTKCTMFISLGANLLNIAGNALLIFGCGLGVAGAAWATLFSRCFSMIVALALLSNPSLLISVSFRKGFRLSWQLVRKILYVGLPGGVENGVFQFGRVVVLSLISTYGTREIAANAVANVIDYFSCVAAGAFGLAVIPVIGRAAGAGDAGQIRFYVRKMMVWTCTVHVFWNIGCFLLMPFLLGCFHKIAPESLRLAVILILIHNGVGMFLWPFSFVFPNVLRALNDVKWPMGISIGSMLVMRIGGSYLFAGLLGSGVLAVWITMILDWLVRIGGFLLRYRSGAWRELLHLGRTYTR